MDLSPIPLSLVEISVTKIGLDKENRHQRAVTALQGLLYHKEYPKRAIKKSSRLKLSSFPCLLLLICVTSIYVKNNIINDYCSAFNALSPITFSLHAHADVISL